MQWILKKRTQDLALKMYKKIWARDIVEKGLEERVYAFVKILKNLPSIIFRFKFGIYPKKDLKWHS